MLAALAFSLLVPIVAKGSDVSVTVTFAGGRWGEHLAAKDSSGRWREILISPHLASLGSDLRQDAAQGTQKGLYQGVPDFRFTDARLEKAKGEQIVVMVAKGGSATFVKRVHIPASGRTIKLELAADFGVSRTPLHALLMSYAFLPYGKKLSGGGKPDSTFLPGLRPKDENVCGDHFFRAPAAVAQQKTLAAILLPDLDVLSENRPMETVLDLDAKNGVCDGTLLTYGFCAHRLSGHVSFATDASLVRRVPGKLRLAADLILDANAEPFAAYKEAADYEWRRYGHRYLDQIKPQMRPFAEYARECYPAVFEEHYGTNKLGWFETTIDGQVCGGIPSGWGFYDGYVSWQCWFNQIRSAWGLHWWGRKLGIQDWIDKSNKMLNLALAAPMSDGLCPTTYDSRKHEWIGCLVTPDPRCYYDLTNIAWKGIWLLRWLDFPDCPRRDEIIQQTSDMAKSIAWRQNADGSFPTWLDQKHDVVPILDHSAQGALPVWFMAEILERYRAETARTRLYTLERPNETYLPGIYIRSQLGPAVLKGARFLSKNVIAQQRYYDFETFFSCSPKRCRQVNGVVDDPAMHDPHSLAPPQNTLSMQWTAEALMRTCNLLPGLDAEAGGFRRGAMNALAMMNLYQNVWPISYRKVAYTYGGFGVQNSDGEYDDARQAQFGCTLCDFGAQLGRQDLFERGVAATRASLALINDPLHSSEGIYPNPNYPLGIEPENDGHGGTDEQDGRSGTDWGESSGLTSMAWLLDRYGQAYEDPEHKWRVGIDGVAWHPTEDRIGTIPSGMAGTRNIEVRSSKGSTRTVKAATLPYEPGEPFVTPTDDAKPGFAKVTALLFPVRDGRDQGDFVNGMGARIKAKVGSFGASDGGAEAHADVPLSFLESPVHYEGSVDGWPFRSAPVRHYFDPAFSFSFGEMRDWTIKGDFAGIPTDSARMNFGLPPGELFIGTAEDDRGGYDDHYVGTITSPFFRTTKGKIRLWVGGGAGEGVYVELLAYDALPPGGQFDEGKRVAIARGANSERMREVVWDTSAFKERYLRIRIVDSETGGWGHINVARIRCGD